MVILFEEGFEAAGRELQQSISLVSATESWERIHRVFSGEWTLTDLFYPRISGHHHIRSVNTITYRVPDNSLLTYGTLWAFLFCWPRTIKMRQPLYSSVYKPSTWTWPNRYMHAEHVYSYTSNSSGGTKLSLTTLAVGSSILSFPYPQLERLIAKGLSKTQRQMKKKRNQNQTKAEIQAAVSSPRSSRLKRYRFWWSRDLVPFLAGDVGHRMQCLKLLSSFALQRRSAVLPRIFLMWCGSLWEHQSQPNLAADPGCEIQL